MLFYVFMFRHNALRLANYWASITTQGEAMGVYVVLAVGLLVAAVLLFLRRRRIRSYGKPKSIPFSRIQSDVEVDSEKITAVVTGGCGCLGREIIRQLIATDRYAVHCLDIFIPPEDKRIAGVVSYIQTDIANFSDVSRALQGMEVVFHTAGLIPYGILNTPEAMERVNLTGTKHILKACDLCGVKRLVYSSSIGVVLSKNPRLSSDEHYDEFAPLPKEPLNAYVRTKGEAENLVREANGTNGLRTCALRLGMVFGGIHNNKAASMFIEGKLPRIGEGDYVAAFTTLKSAAKVCILSEQYLAKGAVSETNVFNVISGNVRLKDFTSFVSILATGKDATSIPVWLMASLTYFNEFAFWTTGFAPLGMGACIMGLDFFVPIPSATQHTEAELGWSEKRPWRDVVKECVEEYKRQEY